MYDLWSFSIFCTKQNSFSSRRQLKNGILLILKDVSIKNASERYAVIERMSFFNCTFRSKITHWYVSRKICMFCLTALFVNYIAKICHLLLWNFVHVARLSRLIENPLLTICTHCPVWINKTIAAKQEFDVQRNGRWNVTIRRWTSHAGIFVVAKTATKPSQAQSVEQNVRLVIRFCHGAFYVS